MNPTLATELQLYRDGLVPLNNLSTVAHQLDRDPDAVRIVFLVGDYRRGRITEAQLRMQLPAVPTIEVERDTEVNNRIPTPPPIGPEAD